MASIGTFDPSHDTEYLFRCAQIIWVSVAAVAFLNDGPFSQVDTGQLALRLSG
jgi:hypothetical protein